MYRLAQPGHYSLESVGSPGPARPASRTPPSTPVVTRPITREVSFNVSYSFIASGDTGLICLGGGGGGGVGGDGVFVQLAYFVMGYCYFRIPAFVYVCLF